MTKKILEDIFPRFGVSKATGSDNSPAFVAQINQRLAKILGFDWKLHCAYRTQSSGQVERMNRTLKEVMAKLSLETGGNNWTALLPYALFRACNTPGPFKLTPYEILFGAHPPLVAMHHLSPPKTHSSQTLYVRLKALEIVQRKVWKQLAEAYKPGDLQVPHQFQVGDAVYVRHHQEPRWKGPTWYCSQPQRQ